MNPMPQLDDQIADAHPEGNQEYYDRYTRHAEITAENVINSTSVEAPTQPQPSIGIYVAKLVHLCLSYIPIFLQTYSICI